MTDLELQNQLDPYTFEAERRHQLMLPLTVVNEGSGKGNPAQEQLHALLYSLLASEVRPFSGIEAKKVVTPDGVPSTAMVLDVFDRPLYLLVNQSYTLMRLQAPVLKGLKLQEEAPVLEHLETFVPDLDFKMAPQRTLGAYQVLTVERFFAQTTTLLDGFCNRVREAAAYVQDHRRQGLQVVVPAEVRVLLQL